MTDLTQIVDPAADRRTPRNRTGDEEAFGDRETADAFDRALANSEPDRRDRSDRDDSTPASPAPQATIVPQLALVAQQNQVGSLADFFQAQDQVALANITAVVTGLGDSAGPAAAAGLQNETTSPILTPLLSSATATVTVGDEVQSAPVAEPAAGPTAAAAVAGTTKATGDKTLATAGQPGAAQPVIAATPLATGSPSVRETAPIVDNPFDPRTASGAVTSGTIAGTAAKSSSGAGTAPAPVAQLRGDPAPREGLQGLIDETTPGILAKADAGPAARAGASPQALAAQLNGQIQQQVRAGSHHFTVQLNPAELGRVEIKLVVRDGTVRASIVAERAETLDLLQQGSRTLERLLGESGLKFEQSSLDFSLRQDGGGQSGQGRQGGEADGGEGFAQILGGDDSADDGTDTAGDEPAATTENANPDGFISRRV